MTVKSILRQEEKVYVLLGLYDGDYPYRTELYVNGVLYDTDLLPVLAVFYDDRDFDIYAVADLYELKEKAYETIETGRVIYNVLIRVPAFFHDDDVTLVDVDVHHDFPEFTVERYATKVDRLPILEKERR